MKDTGSRYGNMEISYMGENKKYDKGTLGWLREQQKIKAKKDVKDN